MPTGLRLRTERTMPMGADLPVNMTGRQWGDKKPAQLIAKHADGTVEYEYDSWFGGDETETGQYARRRVRESYKQFRVRSNDTWSERKRVEDWLKDVKEQGSST